MPQRPAHQHLFQLGHRHLLAMQRSSCIKKPGECGGHPKSNRIHLTAIGASDIDQTQQLLCWCHALDLLYRFKNGQVARLHCFHTSSEHPMQTDDSSL